MYSMLALPIVAGSRAPVFFCGMPIAEVGPVADTISPILTWADAAAMDNMQSAPAARNLSNIRTDRVVLEEANAKLNNK